MSKYNYICSVCGKKVGTIGAAVITCNHSDTKRDAMKPEVMKEAPKDLT